jgi:hypothetical protein
LNSEGRISNKFSTEKSIFLEILKYFELRNASSFSTTGWISLDEKHLFCFHKENEDRRCCYSAARCRSVVFLALPEIAWGVSLAGTGKNVV